MYLYIYIIYTYSIYIYMYKILSWPCRVTSVLPGVNWQARGSVGMGAFLDDRHEAAQRKDDAWHGCRTYQHLLNTGYLFLNGFWQESVLIWYNLINYHSSQWKLASEFYEHPVIRKHSVTSGNRKPDSRGLCLWILRKGMITWGILVDHSFSDKKERIFDFDYRLGYFCHHFY